MRPPALLALALLVLPGCLSGPAADAPPGAAPAPGAPGVLPWSLTECAFLVAFVPVKAERLAPHVPGGFTLSTAGGPLGAVQGEAYVGVEAFQCASGAGLEGEVAPLEYGSFFTAVEPPAALRMEADALFLKWDVLVPDAPRREALLAEGLPARAGTATLERPLGPAPRILATLTLEDVGAFRVDGLVQGQGPLAEGAFVEYMAREDGGVALWRAAWETHALERGRAMVTFEPGSWVAEVAGGQAPASFITGSWTFHDGTITPRLAPAA